jgi:hypothetical protein
MTLTAKIADHFNPNKDDDLYWSESSWFSWAIPEKNICGFFYNHFRPNMKAFLGGPAMWDDSGHYVWDMMYFDWQLIRPLPKGVWGKDYDKYDFNTEFSMGIRTLEALKSYRLQYDRNGFKLDLVYTAIAPPNTIGAHNEGGFDQAYRLHFEQPGRIKGTVSLDGHQYSVNCFSIRDGSHGRRSLNQVTAGGYTWSTADERTGFHVMAADLNNNRENIVKGGYILRDGAMSPIKHGVRRVLKREGPRPVLLEVVAEDEMGRKLHATGREKNWVEFELFGDHGQYWSLFGWQYDGFEDAIGEDQEYKALDEWRRWHRGGDAAWKLR